jgi:hypothetical protein
MMPVDYKQTIVIMIDVIHCLTFCLRNATKMLNFYILSKLNQEAYSRQMAHNSQTIFRLQAYYNFSFYKEFFLIFFLLL